ncbi:unnamed protein product [Ranitomeya imitator]|uniref:FAM91 C-terminal domain-containing protein n=1 Tax=Ranitomeya imitator TaxID=111125 RepID=A0ABN9KP70_9NEOB|nr:unnamed protein product [Ranitomeya imitator]
MRIPSVLDVPLTCIGIGYRYRRYPIFFGYRPILSDTDTFKYRTVSLNTSKEGRAKYACARAVAEDQKRTSWKEDRRRRSGPETPIRPDQQRDRPWNLKSHAVTMFEVGKLSDETLDSFLVELEKVQSTGEGEAQRYFDHALTLRNTILFLRHNKELIALPEQSPAGLPLDLLRCESLLGLDPATCSRVLNKKLLPPGVNGAPHQRDPADQQLHTPGGIYGSHIGPAIPEVSSIWFKLYIYHVSGYGPPSLLLSKGTRLRKLPDVFLAYDRLLITSWGHDPGVVPTSNVLVMLNDALTHSAVLIQGHGMHGMGETAHVPFPFDESELQAEFSSHSMSAHKALQVLRERMDLEHFCGYITMLNPSIHHVNQRRLSDASDGKGELCWRRRPVRILCTSPLERRNGVRHSTTHGCNCAVLTDESCLALGSEVNGSTESFELVVEEFAVEAGQKASEAPSVEKDWVPLELCYGIPLFGSELNQTVCKKNRCPWTMWKREVITPIAGISLQYHHYSSSWKSFQQAPYQWQNYSDCLHHLLHSSRKLSLQVLSFVQSFQEINCAGEHMFETGTSSAMAQPGSSDIGVPLPSKNLIFQNGILSEWNGRARVSAHHVHIASEQA